MKLSYRKIILSVFWIWVAIPQVYAMNSDTKVSKTITEGFVLPKNGHLEVINKYGQILINNSDNDSIIVKLEIVAYGKDRDAATKIMNRVDYDFEKTNEYLTLETILDRKSGVFKELWNNIGDYSKTLLSKNKLEINYRISVPRAITISLTNKFGDIFIAERMQKVEVVMSHGNLRTNDLNAKSNITLSYGQAQIKHVKDGNFIFKASEIDIKSIAIVEIQSSSSEIFIGQAEDVLLDSKNDKSVEIENAVSLKGKMILSKLKIDDLTKDLNIDLNYSDIRVNHIPFNFSLIRIKGRYSDINLDFEPNTYMDVDIKVDEDNFPLLLGALKKEYIDEKRGLARFSGIIGSKNNYKGSLNINSENGEVNIKLRPEQSVKSN